MRDTHVFQRPWSLCTTLRAVANDTSESVSHHDPCRKAELLDVFFVSRSVGEGLAAIRQRYVKYQHVSRREGLQYRRYHVRYIPSMVRERSVPR